MLGRAVGGGKAAAPFLGGPAVARLGEQRLGIAVVGLQIRGVWARTPLGLDPVLLSEQPGNLLAEFVELRSSLLGGTARSARTWRALRQQRLGVLVAGFEAPDFFKALLRFLHLPGLQPLCAPAVQVGQLRPALLGEPGAQPGAASRAIRASAWA